MTHTKKCTSKQVKTYKQNVHLNKY